MTKESRQQSDISSEALQSFASAGQNLNRLIERVSEVLERARPKIALFLEAIQRLPDALHAGLIQLADEGWYLDYEMPLSEPVDIVEAYLAGRYLEVEGHLVVHYRGRLVEIEEELVDSFQMRAHIFRQAFNAHRQGQYYVSVPAFLAQADGICSDFLGEPFFGGDWSESGAPLKKLAHLDATSKAMLAPFSVKTSIRLTKSKRLEGFDKLNRHQVLHGESLDYGTEVRSLQAVAFLYYVAVALKGAFDPSLPSAVSPPGDLRAPAEGDLPKPE